jgi:hypothetical protein
VPGLLHVIGAPDLAARARASLSGLVHVMDLCSGGGSTAQIGVKVWKGAGVRGRVRDARGHRVLLRLRMRGAYAVMSGGRFNSWIQERR